MPDLRYHVISLVSVFLALAVGVLLGVALADRGVIDDQLRGQIDDIRADVEAQRGEISRQEERISRLQERTATDRRLMSGMSQVLVEGGLEGADVALVKGPYANETAADRLQETISDSGAELTSILRLQPPGINEETTVASTDLASGSSVSYAGYAREVLVGSGGMNDPEVIVFIGGGDPPQGVSDDALDTLSAAQMEMFEIWSESGVRVVAAETSSGRTEVPLFEDAGVPSVDNAGAPAGRAAFIELAAGGAEGSYGTKDSASEPFPSPPS